MRHRSMLCVSANLRFQKRRSNIINYLSHFKLILTNHLDTHIGINRLIYVFTLLETRS